MRPPRPIRNVRRALVLLAIAAITAFATPATRAELRTFDRKYPIELIQLRMVYFVPHDRPPLPDWRDRLDYFRRRVEGFHAREFQGQSRLEVAIHPEPFRSRLSTAELRAGDADALFFRTLGEVDTALHLGGRGPRGDREKGDADRHRPFPILLVLSDINWRPLDDFYRLSPGPDGPRFEGTYNDGRHHPGAASGGARATYLADRGMGWGLVSGDGWRVPYRGSDCVIYHEGLGHTIGLPHTESADDSVMSMGQYHGWINESWIDRRQKERLGWKAPTDPPPGAQVDDRSDLFRRFLAVPDPAVPRPGEPMALALTWPDGARVRRLRVRIQTDVFGPWLDLPAPIADPARPPGRVALPALDRPVPVSYRVDVELEDGRRDELWGYFQVRERPDRSPVPAIPTPDLAADAASPAGPEAAVEEIDLLARIDPARDGVSGAWVREGGVLTSPKAYGARVEVPYMPPDEYRLTVIVEPLDEPNALVLGARAGGRRFQVLVGFVQPSGAPVSALENLDGHNFAENVTAVRQPFFRKGRPSEVVATVRKDGVEVVIDGRPAIRWRGDPGRLSLNDYWRTPHDEALFLGAYDCRYRFQRVSLAPISGAGRPLREPGVK